MRRTHPQTSETTTLKAQCGAAMAKSIAGVAMLCGILALVVLMARDVRTSNASHHDNSVALRAETTELRSTAPGASPVSSEMPDEQQRLDPKEIYNYQLNVHG